MREHGIGQFDAGEGRGVLRALIAVDDSEFVKNLLRTAQVEIREHPDTT